jgi:hypothetical protein
VLTAHAMPPEDDLAAEARIVTEARTAFTEGLFDQVLASLDDHDRRFPFGALLPESGAVRVAALCAAGRLDEARAIAKALRTRFPSALVASHAPSRCVEP